MSKNSKKKKKSPLPPPRVHRDNLFCLPRRPTPKDIQFYNDVCDKEKQEILSFEELEPENGWHFFTISGWKMTEAVNGLSK